MGMNAVTKDKNQIKTKYMIMLFTIGLGLILSLPLIFVEAAPRDPGFDRRGECSEKTDNNNNIISKTCCWREPVPGQILGKTYCQTCDKNFLNCGDKVAQSYNRNIPDVVNQPTVPLTQQPPIESDKDPLIGDKITKEPLQNSNSNEENNDNA
jgi:hypothetical protein